MASSTQPLIKDLNEKIAIWSTKVFGSMGAVYVFLFYGLIGIIFVAWQLPLLYVSNVLQLVSLPLIMVGTNLLGRANELRAQKQAQEIEDIHTKLDTILDKMACEVHKVLEIEEKEFGYTITKEITQ